MALSNAERQRRYVQRLKAKAAAAVTNDADTNDEPAVTGEDVARIAQLEAALAAARDDIARLEAALADARLRAPGRSPGGARDYLGRLAALEKAASALPLAWERTEALREIAKTRNGLIRIDQSICRHERKLGFQDLTDKREKIKALVDQGATEGERAAAAAAMARVAATEDDRSGEWKVMAPQPLPKTREEMLARRRRSR